MMPEKPQGGCEAGHKGIFPGQMNAKVTISDCVSLCQGSDCYKPPVFPWRIWAQINTPAWSWKLKSLQYSSTIYDSSTEEYLIWSSWVHIVARGKGNAKYWEGLGTLVIVNGSCWFCLSRISFNCIKICSESQWLFSYWWLHHRGAGIATHTDSRCVPQLTGWNSWGKERYAKNLLER